MLTNSSPEDYRATPTKVLSASLGVKVGALIGVPATAYAASWLLLVPARQYYNWPDELGTFLALACTTFLFSVCWGAVCAYVIRRLNLSPRTCGLPGLPFLIAYIVLFTFWYTQRGYRDVAAIGAVAGQFANLLCWKFAYPTVDPKSVYRTWSSGLNLFQR